MLSFSKNCFYIFSLITFSINLKAHAQTHPATLYFNDGDSIEGYAYIKKNNKVKFRIDTKSKADVWDHESIYRVTFETIDDIIIYDYVKLKDRYKPILLENITDGEVTLYKNITTSYVLHAGRVNGYPNQLFPSKTTNYYLKRSNDEYPTNIESLFKSWKTNTIKFLHDCPILIKKIKSNEFRKDDMKDIVIYYNDFCTEL